MVLPHIEFVWDTGSKYSWVVKKASKAVFGAVANTDVAAINVITVIAVSNVRNLLMVLLLDLIVNLLGLILMQGSNAL